LHAAYLDGGFQVLPSMPNIGPMIGMINLLFLLAVCWVSWRWCALWIFVCFLCRDVS